MRQHYIAATAGHIDHGKSALVQALTGVDPDRLPEEKRRGITIELGFAHVDLQADGESAQLRVGIVDVPGHEDFVKNMVAGVSAVDIALMVVAADDGWMPQSEEHLQILEYLGARSLVAVITKSDLSADLAPLRATLAERLARTVYSDSPIVAVSAVREQGIAELMAEMANTLQALSQRIDRGKPRLAVDRVFSVAGAGTVVTGTLAGGALAARDEVEVLPGGARARIRSLQSFNNAVEAAQPATRVALNLPEVKPGRGGETVQRGDVVCRPAQVHQTRRVDLRLRRSDRPVGARELPPLRTATRIRVHHGTANLAASVTLADTGVLLAGGSGFARLLLDQPRPMLSGDRVVLRDWSQTYTLAGGVVLDPAPTGRLRDTARQAFLTACAAAPDALPALLAARVEQSIPVSLTAFAALVPDTGSAVKRCAAQLVADGAARRADDLLLAADRFEAGVTAAVGVIDTALENNPQRGGVALSVVRQQLEQWLRQPGPPLAYGARRGRSLLNPLLDAVVEELLVRGYRRDGANIAPPGHQASLPPQLQSGLAAVRDVLAATPLTPPSTAALAERGGREVIDFLCNSGEALALSAEVILSRVAYDQAVAAIERHLQEHGAATTSALRTAVGTNRRVIVPLLEYLDREGMTVRVGNERRLDR